MTVGELKKMLKQYPDDMEVITDTDDGEYSFAVSLFPIKGINMESWVGRFRPGIHDENRKDIKEYIYIS